MYVYPQSEYYPQTPEPQVEGKRKNRPLQIIIPFIIFIILILLNIANIVVQVFMLIRFIEAKNLLKSYNQYSGDALYEFTLEAADQQINGVIAFIALNAAYIVILCLILLFCKIFVLFFVLIYIFYNLKYIFILH